MGKREIIFSLLCSLALATYAEDDFGLWTSIGAQKKIDKQWSIELDGGLRMRDNISTADRWDIGINGGYKIAKWLRVSAGYTLLYDNNEEKTTYKKKDSSKKNKYTPSYWGIRHRFTVALTGQADIGRVTLSLRERWQYTYRPEKTVERYDYDEEAWEDKTVRGKGKNVLRSRLKAKYNIRKSDIDPFAEVELFNSWSLQKTRLKMGADWKISKHHALSLAYGYQDVGSNDDDGDANTHFINIGYEFKF